MAGSGSLVVQYCLEQKSQLGHPAVSVVLLFRAASSNGSDARARATWANARTPNTTFDGVRRDIRVVVFDFASQGTEIHNLRHPFVEFGCCDVL